MIDFGFDLAGRKDPRLARGMVWSSLGAIAQAAPVLVLFYALREVFEGRSEALSVGWITGALVGLLFVAYLFRLFGSLDGFIATYGLVTTIRLRLADHLRRLPMGFFNSRRRGTLASVLTDEFSLYTEIATHAWTLVIANTAFPLALAAILVWADWRLAVVALAPVPVALLAVPWSFGVINRASDRLSDTKQAMVAELVETLDGLPTLSTYQAATPFEDRVRLRSDALVKAQFATELAPAPAIAAFGLLVHAGIALLLVAGARWVANGTVGGEQLVLVAILAVHFARNLSEAILWLSASRHAARTLKRVRDLFERPVQPEGTATVPDGAADLAVEGVTFSYGDGDALRDVSVVFPKGSVTALVGPSGSGKSTLAHLLSRLWDVGEGRITLGGVDLRELPLSVVHKHVATVFQDVVLFQETVFENIRLGRPDATREQVEAAARAAGAHAFVEALPDGYDTELQPGGGGLSGGEQQRIAIARALLKDAPILVLDEATASVDPEREHEIQAAIARLMEGRTVVVVAHRLWTIQDVDQIVVLQDGGVVARGTHDALLAGGGLYATLWEAQQAAGEWSLSAA